jgi:hypothetical protein
MKQNKLNFIFKWRFFSVVLSFCMATAANMYLRLTPLYLVVVWHFSLMMVCYVFKDRPYFETLNKISRSKGRLFICLFTVSFVVGVMAFLGEARLEERFTSLLFPVVTLDLIISVFSLIFFCDSSKWQHGRSVSQFGPSSEKNHVNDRIAAAYADSGYDVMSNETHWPQSDYHANSITDSSLGVNPASGLPMANDAIDIGGNVYGFGESSFVNYDHHTSQFSDFDYHNHS